jgi:hypothetical protein
MRAHWLLLALLYLQALFLVLYADGFHLSASEAAFFYEGQGWLHQLLHASTALFGQSNLGIRLPFITLHLINLVLLYLAARDLVRKPFDAWLAVLIFALLPGVNSAALLINAAGVVMMLTLLFVWLLPRARPVAYLLLLATALLHEAFLMLSFAVVIYGFYRRDWPLMGVSMATFVLSFTLFGFDARGRPEGYFMDVFGLYGAIFSPLVFLAFIYGAYWFLIRYERTLPLLWFVSVAVFGLSILLSLRQQLALEDFAPYVVIGTPLLVMAFMNSWRIRLPGFRRFHAAAAGIMLGSLVLLSALSFFSKPLYLIGDRPRSHFAYDHHYVPFLLEALKEAGLEQLQLPDANLARQLAFYGIKSGGAVVLDTRPPAADQQKALTLEYTVFNRVVSRFYLYALESEMSVTSSSI